MESFVVDHVTHNVLSWFSVQSAPILISKLKIPNRYENNAANVSAANPIRCWPGTLLSMAKKCAKHRGNWLKGIIMAQPKEIWSASHTIRSLISTAWLYLQYLHSFHMFRQIWQHIAAIYSNPFGDKQIWALVAAEFACDTTNSCKFNSISNDSLLMLICRSIYLVPLEWTMIRHWRQVGCCETCLAGRFYVIVRAFFGRPNRGEEHKIHAYHLIMEMNSRYSAAKQTHIIFWQKFICMTTKSH